MSEEEDAHAGPQWKKEALKEAQTEILNELPAFKALFQGGGARPGASSATTASGVGPSGAGLLSGTGAESMDEATGECYVVAGRGR